MSNKKGEKKGKTELVPELRFPEFRDAGNWKEEKLSSVVQLISGLHLSPDQYSNEGSVPYFTGPSDFTDRMERISKWTGELTNIAEKNDTLITVKGSGVGEIWYLRLPRVAIGRQLMAIRSTTSSSRFIYQFLLIKRTRFEDLASGNLIPGLSRGDILDLEAGFPSFLEQQKIATCLSSLDELTTLEAQKLDTLKAHKKGLMQQLFPAEGKTLPKLRFPEFQDAGEWEVKKIEELAKRGSGHTPSKRKPDYYNGGIKWVSLADSSKLDNGYIYETKVEISKEGIENSSAVLHPPGTVIISRDAGVGKSAILHSSMAVSQHFIAWLCDKSKLSNWFLYYFLQILKPKFEDIATGSTIKTIGLSYFKEFCIPIPSIPEQQKIATCLSSLDDLITAQTQKIETLKAHKKGLMQQLFPALDEVQG